MPQDESWLRFWKLQRDEISARLVVSNGELSDRKELSDRITKEKELLEEDAESYKSEEEEEEDPTGGPSFAATEELKNRIGALTEAKQVLLSNYIRFKHSKAITMDADGVGTIDPYRLDMKAFQDVIMHLDFLDVDYHAGPPKAPNQHKAAPRPVPGRAKPGEPEQPFMTPTKPSTMAPTMAPMAPTMPILPPRDRALADMRRPADQAAATLPYPVPADSMVPAYGVHPHPAMYWPSYRAPAPAAAALSHSQSLPPIAPQPVQARVFNSNQTPSLPPVFPPHATHGQQEPVWGGPSTLSEEDLERRKTLASAIALLPPMQQQMVSQEVYFLAPHAILATSAGILTINTSDLNTEAYEQISIFVDHLQQFDQTTGKQDEMRHKRRQKQREEFLIRERARERERVVALETERKLRQMEIDEEIEEDLAMVREETEKTLRKMRSEKTEAFEPKAGQLQSSSDEDIHSASPEMSDFSPAPSAPYSPTAQEVKQRSEQFRVASQYEIQANNNENKLELHTLLKSLQADNLLAFAEFASTLQPGIIQNNSIQPAALSDEYILPCLIYAKQMKRKELEASEGPIASEVDPSPIMEPLQSPCMKSGDSKKRASVSSVRFKERFDVPKAVSELGQATPLSFTDGGHAGVRILLDRFYSMPQHNQETVIRWMYDNVEEDVMTGDTINLGNFEEVQLKEMEHLLAELEVHG